jgi:hypothetical protein
MADNRPDRSRNTCIGHSSLGSKTHALSRYAAKDHRLDAMVFQPPVKIVPEKFIRSFRLLVDYFAFAWRRVDDFASAWQGVRDQPAAGKRF